MKVQILGVGCPKCKQLMANTEQAIRDLGLQTEVEKVEDIRQIARFRVLSTPALVVDGQVKSVGKVLSPTEIAKLLS